MSALADHRADLPLSDWKSTKPHTADECALDQCDYCGCCGHGKTLAAGCKVEVAPYGMRCPDTQCACGGLS